MEQETIRHIKEKIAKVKRDVTDPRTVAYWSAAAGGAIGVVCAPIVYGIASPVGDSLTLIAGLAFAGGAIGFGVAKGVPFVREKIDGLRERLARRGNSHAEYKDNLDGL